MFDVTIVDRRGEVTLQPTSAVTAVYGLGSIKLVHRPGICDGEVRIIWPKANGPLLKEWPRYDPLQEVRDGSSSREAA